MSDNKKFVLMYYQTQKEMANVRGRLNALDLSILVERDRTQWCFYSPQPVSSDAACNLCAIITGLIGFLGVD